MRGSRKQILVLVLLIASVAVLTRLTQNFWLQPKVLEDFGFSQRGKDGFTIWGIQPGDSMLEILQEMPPNTTAELIEGLHGRETLLKGPRDRRLELTTVETDEGEVVAKVRADPVQDSTTLELNGNPVLIGRWLTDEDIKEVLPGAKRLPDSFEAIKFGQRIKIGYEGPYCLDSMELTLSDMTRLNIQRQGQ